MIRVMCAFDLCAREQHRHNLIEENRVKRRRQGAGPTEKIDEECEQFMAKAIESKTTYHGRRKEPVMFTNRRVKGRDLREIANNAWLQTNKVIGKGIVLDTVEANSFLLKKPPKTEDKYNENKHYQCVHVKGI